MAPPAPLASNASAAATASFGELTVIPVIASASVSFGVTKSHRATMEAGSSAAGAGLRIVVAPAFRAQAKAYSAASIGCSS